jgi:hypothetical protein
MRRRVAFAVVVVAGLLGAVAWQRAPAPAPQPPAPVRPPVTAAPVTAVARREPAPDPSVLDTPEARTHLARADFEERARRFFADPAAFAPAAREREAQALTAMIDGYEGERQLSAGEAMNLRIGLVRATVADEATQLERVADIVTAYHADGARREARFLEAQRNDAAFNEYKTREQAIVAEVMALDSIPGGLTREEYLRQRLQAERVALSR